MLMVVYPEDLIKFIVCQKVPSYLTKSKNKGSLHINPFQIQKQSINVLFVDVYMSAIPALRL